MVIQGQVHHHSREETTKENPPQTQIRRHLDRKKRQLPCTAKKIGKLINQQEDLSVVTWTYLPRTQKKPLKLKNMKTVYQITKKLRDGHGPNQYLPVKAEECSAITEEMAKLERQREHFEKIMNRRDPPIPPDIDEAEIDLEIKMGPITLNEV